MAPPRARAARPSLDAARLNELALSYVGRFSTTRAKLRSYLMRKIRERGWEGESEPDLEGIAARCSEYGYIDDRAYALAKSQALAGRGYGKRRLVASLRAAGVEEDDGEDARNHADGEALGAALKFAQRRRLGPFALSAPLTAKDREKALAAIVRAGHSFALAREIVALAPGSEIDPAELAERAHL